jgi:transposase-like protein
MELALHANATTTPRTRSYIQRSKKSVAELAGELGVSETTIRRWRHRTTVGDRSHRPNRLTTSLSAMEETLVCELRTSLQLPLDDIVEVMRRCINDRLSRSAIHRCLQRHGISRRKKPDKPSVGVFEQATVGFIHIDLKHLPALERRKSYAFVAIDRATRYVYVEIHRRRDAKTSAAFLKRFLAHFPCRVHTILTDNGAEFTDRFAVDMKNKPQGRPSGNHPFDLFCANHKIDHRLTRPYRPQTNGLVERFNRRIAEAIGREPKRGSARRTFICHADRDAFLSRFVADYNRTRLKCLGYLAPLEALANLPGPNTFAGTTRNWQHSTGRHVPLQAGYPVRGGLTALPRRLWNTGSPAAARHRAARGADPVAGDDNQSVARSYAMSGAKRCLLRYSGFARGACAPE